MGKRPKRVKTKFKLTATIVVYHDDTAPPKFVAEIARRYWRTYGLWGAHVDHGSYGVDKPAQLVACKRMV